MAGVGYTIRQVRARDRIDAVIAFYKAHPDAHVWPRTPEELSQLAEDLCLFEVVDEDGQTVAAAYTKDDPSENRWELGGLYVVKECRGSGLAKMLGRVRIIGLYTQLGLVDERVISHVHESNDDPRPLLESLGFVRDGEEIAPPHVVPADMKRNDKGEVVGHLYVFNAARLGEFADWLERFDGTAKNGAKVQLDLAMYTRDRGATIAALRSAAAPDD